MKIRWKRIGIVGGVFVLGLIVLLYTGLTFYDFNTLKPILTEAVKNSTGQKLSFGQVKLKIGLIPVLVVEDVRLENPAWASRPDLLRIRRMELEVALLALLKKNVDIRRLVLFESDIQIENDRSGVSNLSGGLTKGEGKKESPSHKIRKFPSLGFREVTLEKAQVTFRDAECGTTFSVIVEHLEAMAENPNAPIHVNLRGRFKKKAFAIEALMGSHEELMKADVPWPLNVTIHALGVEMRIEGSIIHNFPNKAFPLTFQAKGKSTRELTEFLDFPNLPEMGPFKVAMTASELGTKSYKFPDLHLGIKDGEVSGNLEINVAGKRPTVTGTLSFQGFDLRPFLPKKDATEEKKKGGRVFSEKPFRVDFLKALDGDLKIRAKQITTPYASVNNVRIDALLNDGRLTLKPVKALVGGGPIDGHVGCFYEGEKLTVAGELKVDALDLKRTLKHFGVAEVAEGTIDAAVEFSSSGDSLAALMAQLSGKSLVAMGNGKIRKQFIELLGGDLSSGISALLGSAQVKEGSTEVRCAVSSLNIKDGLATVTALVLDTRDTTVYGSGDVDFKTEKLNLSLEPLPKRGLMGLSLSLSELAKPFKLGGTLANPSLAIDPTRTAWTLGKAIAGIAFFGPLGLAGALAGKTSDENPCAAALEAAKKAAKASEQKNAGNGQRSAESETGLTKDLQAVPFHGVQ